MNSSTTFIIAATICLVATPATSFFLQTPTRQASAVLLAAVSPKTTLTDETNWSMRMVLRGVTTEQGKKVDEIFNVQCQFLEEEGYEPPQGIVQMVNPSEDESEEQKSRFQIAKSRWILSEDPEDRKDGLWVWGLFKEPLYPFMLLKLETESIPLPSGNEEEGDAIKPLQLYAQINHKRDSGNVVLEASDLKVRQMETVNADVFGAAKVDVYEEVNIGTLSVLPAAGKSALNAAQTS